MDRTHVTSARILIVEDDAEVRSVLRRQLQHRLPGVSILEAGDAKAGLAALASTPIDLILCDYHMPGMTGVEFFAKVRAEFPTAHRIMLTGAPEPALAVTASREAGAIRFFVKPPDFGALAQTILRLTAPRKPAYG
jgi:CheY-like chemotaxis protein